MNRENDIAIYQDAEGALNVSVRFAEDDIWLTQKQLAEIYSTTQQNISLHIDKIYKDIIEVNNKIQLLKTPQISGSPLEISKKQRNRIYTLKNQGSYNKKTQILNLKNLNINHAKMNTNSNIFCNISLNKNIESLSHRISKLTKNKTISLTTPESLLKIKNIKKDIIKKKTVVYDNKNNSISNHNLISNYLDTNRSNMNKNVFEHKKNLVLKQFNSKKEISYFWKNRNESSKTYSLNEINNIRGIGNSSVSNSQKKKSNYLVPKIELIGDRKSKKNHQKKINLNLNLHINLNINIAKKNKKTLSGNLMNNNCLKGLLTQRNLNIPKRNTYNKLLSIYHSKNKLTKNIKSETSFK